jgi:hypothetical protein
MSAQVWVEVDAGVAGAVGAIVAVAAVRKLRHRDVFALTLRRLDRALAGREQLSRLLGVGVAVYEAVVAVGVNAFRGTPGFVFACGMAVACAGFLAALVRAVQQSVPCACFGRLGRTAAGGREIARALVLLGGAAFLALQRAVASGTGYGFGFVAAAAALGFLVVVAAAQSVGARLRPGADVAPASDRASLSTRLRDLAGVDNDLYAPGASTRAG